MFRINVSYAISFKAINEQLITLVVSFILASLSLAIIKNYYLLFVNAKYKNKQA